MRFRSIRIARPCCYGTFRVRADDDVADESYDRRCATCGWDYSISRATTTYGGLAVDRLEIVRLDPSSGQTVRFYGRSEDY